MKILQLIQKKQLRGAEVFASQLSQNLQEQGHEVEMLALLEGEQQLPFTGKVQVIHADLSKRFWDFRAWKNLAVRVKQFQPDIIQANAGDTLKYAVFSKLFLSWKSKLVFRNANKMSDFLDSPIKFWMNRFLIKRVDAVASVSEECRLDFLRTFSDVASLVKTIPIGVEELQLKAYTDLTILGIPAQKRVLLSVASFVPEKNHAGLLQIFQSILQYFPDTCLLLIGEGKWMDHTKHVVRDAGLKDAVFFAGSRSDVLQIMPCCEALLMPSLIEGLPGVILEAFQSRLPVLAYEVGGIPEVLTNITGWPIVKGDEQSFTQALVQLLTASKEEKVLKTEAAFQLVKTKYLNKDIAERFEDLYKLCCQLNY